MKAFILFSFLILFFISSQNAFAEIELNSLCPLCTKQGQITCPNGFEAFCEENIPGETKPRCLYLGTSYVPGCWKAAGYRKLDLSLFNAKDMPPSTMVQITGGGQVYTLNRETISCRKVLDIEFKR